MDTKDSDQTLIATAAEQERRQESPSDVNSKQQQQQQQQDTLPTVRGNTASTVVAQSSNEASNLQQESGFLSSTGGKEYLVPDAAVLEKGLIKEAGDDVKQKPVSKWERYLCCCCPKRPLYRIICGSVVLAVLIVIGVLAGIYFPRFPDTQVYDIDLTNLAGRSSAFHFSYLNDTEDLNKLVIQLNLTMHVGTYNPNLYGLTVDQIDLVARLLVNTTYTADPLRTTSLMSYGSLVKVVGKPPVNPNPGTYFGKNDSIIGTAKTTESIFFPSKTLVNYTLNFELYYTPDPQLGLLLDPTVLELADGCGITSRYKPPGRPMRVHYKATSTISSLKALNFAPSLESSLLIRCPFDQSQIDAVISYVSQGLSVSDALKVVFEGAQVAFG
ncbi:hypothetical protein BDR26DRAFT_858394 [Obelidium mucronatum]|nr:hypothetical protein BDR26DRAFT_858394 [Obelidium mucronatum]